MKKSIIILLFTFFSIFSLIAKPIKEIWTDPAFFRADEKVTIYFDLTGTDLDSAAIKKDKNYKYKIKNLYFWSWYPTEPDKGHWTNPSDFTKMTKVPHPTDTANHNIWKIEFTPTQYYNAWPASLITNIYGLIKDSAGIKVTEPFAPGEVISGIPVPITDASRITQTYPTFINPDRPFSIVVNTQKTWSGCESVAKQGELSSTNDIYLYGIANNKIIPVLPQNNLEKTRMTNLGEGYYKLDFKPKEYFSAKDVYNITYIIQNADGSIVGKDQSCREFFVKANLPNPEALIFPQKISAKDILTIIRKNNESDIAKLTFYIKDNGTTLISGDFEGTKKEMKGYIDLVTLLKGKNLDKIHITVVDNLGRTYMDTDVSLIK